MESNEQLEKKIKEIQDKAEKKHYEYRIGPICKGYTEFELAKHGFRMNHEHKYNMAQHCPIDKIDVFYKENLVYAYVYGTVTAYIPGEWEKKIPDMYDHVIRKKNIEEKSKERAIRDEKKKILRDQAKRFGIKTNNR